MSPPTVDPAQVAKAVAALRKHLEKVKAEGKAQLFDGEDDGGEAFSVTVSTRRVPQRGSNKLVPIAIPHPLLDLSTAEVCLIVKDKEGEGHKEAKRRVAALEDKCGVAKVLGISKLRNNYKPHEAKRKLCDSYDLFVADARVIPILPKLLGKTFFKKRRQPIPIDATKADLGAQIRKAAASTYAHAGAGTCLRVKVGRAHERETHHGERHRRDRGPGRVELRPEGMGERPGGVHERRVRRVASVSTAMPIRTKVRAPRGRRRRRRTREGREKTRRRTRAAVDERSRCAV